MSKPLQIFIHQCLSLSLYVIHHQKETQRPSNKFTSSFLFIWFFLCNIFLKKINELKWKLFLALFFSLCFLTLCGRWAFIRNFLMTYFPSFSYTYFVGVWWEVFHTEWEREREGANKIFDWIKLFSDYYYCLLTLNKKDWITRKCFHFISNNSRDTFRLKFHTRLFWEHHLEDIVKIKQF